MNDKIKVVLSFVSFLFVIGIGQFFELYKTQYETLIIFLLILSWFIFISYTMTFIFKWYKKDLAKRTQDELERIENLDEDEEPDEGWIPKLF